MKKHQMLLATMVATVISVPLGAKLLSGPIRADEAIPLDSQHFPDSAFLEVVKEFDLNEDGSLDAFEICTVDRIICGEKGIKSLEGIEYFTSLTFLDCSENGISNLDVSENKALESLYCGHNSLTTLDLRGAKKLSVLDCGDNYIRFLDLRGCKKLTKVSCSNNPHIGGGDESGFHSQDQVIPGSLGLEENSELTELKCNNCGLSSLYIFHLEKLTNLSCMNNRLSTLLIGKSHLSRLACDNNEICTLLVSLNDIVSLSCSNNRLTSWSFSGEKVEYLNISNNCIKDFYSTYDEEMMKEKFPNLREFDCSKNYLLSKPKVSDSVRLTYEPQKTLSFVEDLEAKSESANSVTVSWGRHQDVVVDVQVFYSTNEKGPFKNIRSGHTSDEKIDGLKPCTNYYIKARHYVRYSTEGEDVYVYGPYSQVISCKTRGTEVVQNVGVVAKSASSAEVSWDKVNGASGYQVWRSTSANGSFTALGSVTDTSRVCTGLVTGTKYYFKVRAYEEVDGKRYYGEFSQVVSVSTVPSTPTGLKASVASATKITVSWNKAAGATGYDVYRSTTENGTYSRLGSVTTTSRDCPGLVTGTKYYFKVRAYKEVDGKKVYGAYSAVVSAVPVPSAPTNVKASAVTATKINVSWSKATGATGYEVWRSESADGKFTKLGTVTTTNRDCPGLQKGKTYYFKVRAYVEVNGTKYYGAYSSVVSAKTPTK